MNILTFDIEEWFHLLDNDSSRTEAQWGNFESRIHDNVDRILQLLEERDTKATFFIVGWIAKQYPEVVRKIAQSQEIGSHTMNHQLVWQQSPKEFKEDISASIHLLQDITGQAVTYFRAPGFSIRESEGWALEVLKECGIEIDCSVFPATHAHGGMPAFKEAKPSILSYRGIQLKEFPIGYKKILNQPIVFSGGGYFRLFPYWLIKRWSRESSDYLCSYLHPRDFDAGQPILEELSLPRRFKAYVGLKHSEEKLRRWLTDFSFINLSQADRLVDWKSCPEVHIP